jgi:hypothetical protein
MQRHAGGHLEALMGGALLAIVLAVSACDQTPASPTVQLPSLELTGTVFGDHQPIANASVTVASGAAAVTAKTDASGRYSARILGFPVPVTFFVTALAPERFTFQPCATWFETTGPDPLEVDVALSSAEGLLNGPPARVAGRRNVSGTIYTPTSTGKQPVSEAHVAWDLSADNFKAWTQTDGAGRFVLCGLPMNLSLSIFSQHGRASGLSTVAPGGDVDIEMVLRD